MAHIANSAAISWPLAVLSAIGRGFESIYLAISVLGNYDGRLQEVHRLQALTDAQLAEKGLSRDEIVRHVFRDLYYI